MSKNKQLTKWEVTKREIIADSKWMKFGADWCITQRGVEIPGYYWYWDAPYSTIFGTTKDGKVVMIEQYRHGIKDISLEFPKGRVEIGEDMLEVAKHELLEETGYIADELIFERELYQDMARSDKKGYLFFARNLVDTGAQHLEDVEDIIVRLVTFDELEKMVDNKELNNFTELSIALLALQKRDWFLNHKIV